MLALVMCPVWCGILAQIHIWVLNGLSFSSSQGALTPALLVPLLGFAFILTMFKTCNLFKIVPKIKREARHRAVLPTLQQQTRDPNVPIVLSQPLLEPPRVGLIVWPCRRGCCLRVGPLTTFSVSIPVPGVRKYFKNCRRNDNRLTSVAHSAFSVPVFKNTLFLWWHVQANLLFLLWRRPVRG